MSSNNAAPRLTLAAQGTYSVHAGPSPAPPTTAFISDTIDGSAIGEHNMREVTREEIDAKLEAVEARMDTRIAQMEGKLDTVMARIEVQLQSISAQTTSQVGELANTKRELRSLILGSWAIIIASVLAIYFGLDASNKSLLSNMLSSFQAGISVLDVRQNVATPNTSTNASRASDEQRATKQ